MRIGRLPRDSVGGSVVLEFAIIAPVLVLAVLATADIGLAIHEASEVDQAMRNGAEAALNDPGESLVGAVLVAVDTTGSGPSSTHWSVDRYHACREAPDTRFDDPIMTCAGSRASSIFYKITGVRAYAGIFLPARDLTRTASVQVR